MQSKAKHSKRDEPNRNETKRDETNRNETRRDESMDDSIVDYDDNIDNGDDVGEQIYGRTRAFQSRPEERRRGYRRS